MTPTPKSLVRFWLVAFAVFVAVLWLFKPVLLPFAFGLALAYFLEPVVAALEKRKVPRYLGSFIVLAGFLFVIASIFFLIWPMLSSQIQALVDALPDYVAKIREDFLPSAQRWFARLAPESVEKLREAAGQSTGAAVGIVGSTVKNIVSGGFVLVDAVAFIILAPVTAFYLLRDWEKLTHTIDQMIPRASYDIVKAELAKIDNTLSGFLRGQALVCVALGFIYSLGLSLNNLQYGFTIGIIAGVLSIMPYVGSTFCLVSSMLLAFVQFHDDWLRIGLVFLVFVVGQFLEGYVLTPRFVGNRVGLHPVWVFFAVIAGIKFLGFLGALIAVPTAAVVGVLLRFGVHQYKASSIYK